MQPPRAASRTSDLKSGYCFENEYESLAERFGKGFKYDGFYSQAVQRGKGKAADKEQFAGPYGKQVGEYEILGEGLEAYPYKGRRCSLAGYCCAGRVPDSLSRVVTGLRSVNGLQMRKDEGD